MFAVVRNKALFFGDKVQENLLNPDQLRASGLPMDDTS